MIRKLLKQTSIWALCLISFQSFGQLSYEGQPYQWEDKKLNEEIATVTFGALDMELVRSQDEVTDQYKETPYRFGIEYDVNLSIVEDGTSYESENGDRIYQLGIQCEGAKSISMNFDEYKLEKGCKVFIFNEDRTDFLGAFDHRNGVKQEALAIGLLRDDFVVVELLVPADIDVENVNLHLNQVTHGYRAIANKWDDPDRGPFGNSGLCNINVNCPEGDDWQIEKKSVGLIVSGGFASCSGALVNNTNNDGTPYFLTANHCLGGGVGSWVFYFNHETVNCTGSSDTDDQTISGSELIASNSGSDFALLLLDENPLDEYDVEYVGWDATDDETVITTTGIHHPSGDWKKICHDFDEPYHTTSGGAQVWYIDEWEEGVTEGGSSGSPLFDQNHRVIGQLYGGFAACSGSVNNGQADWYGRFGVSWDGSSPQTRLKDWLDPGNTGTLILDGFPTGFTVAEFDAAGSGVSGIDETVCSSTIWPTYTLRNNGSETLTSATITFSINGEEEFFIEWSGSLEQYESEEVDLFGLFVQDGENEFIVTVSNPNGQIDENESNNTTIIVFEAITGDTHIFTVNILLDDYGSETTWEIRDGSTVLYTGGPYQDNTPGELVEKVVCVGTGCYDFVIYDSYGDGICCDYGEGAYTVYNEFNNVAAEGGTFEDSESTNICTAPINVEEWSFDDSVNVYPNPVNNNLFIEIDEQSDVYDITITSIDGKVVSTLNRVSGNIQMDASSWATGLYIVEVFSGEQYSRKKIIVE